MPDNVTKLQYFVSGWFQFGLSRSDYVVHYKTTTIVKQFLLQTNEGASLDLNQQQQNSTISFYSHVFVDGTLSLCRTI